MEFVYSKRFIRLYKRLTAVERSSIDKALYAMQEDMRSPGLRVKKMQGHTGIWEARASRDLTNHFRDGTRKRYSSRLWTSRRDAKQPVIEGGRDE
jgi:hypothetical protein